MNKESKYKISIITINYNNVDGLKRTVESVINQTWREFEYIIIDGGSADGSAQYIQENQEHFHYWVSEPDKGIYNAMNKGIKVANGEYLLFLNSGDWFFNNQSLAEVKHTLVEIDVISFAIRQISRLSEDFKLPPHSPKIDFFITNALAHQATFIKASLFHKLGLYDEELLIVSDWKFFVQAFLCNCSYKAYNTILANFDKNGISNEQFDLMLREKGKVLENDFGFVYDVIKNKENRIVNLEHNLLKHWIYFHVYKHFKRMTYK